MSAEYKVAYEKSAIAIREFTKAQEAYRASAIGDDEYLVARSAYNLAMAEYDEAYNKENC